MSEDRRGGSAPSVDLIRAIRERDERKRKKEGRVQEGMGSLMFGVLSIAIGSFVLFVAVSGLLDRPVPGWTEPYSIMVVDDVEYSRSPWTNRLVATPVKVEGRRIEVPSKTCAVMVLVGIGLGGAGVALEQRKPRRRGVILSVAGAVLCAVAIGLPLLVCVTLNLAG
ncbi:hypothetical protein [Tautonia rosea]|uniref:hypothetical protein n=1 Tax=Tautonia rosea TaxID=2728037 RepID=UPI0014732A20|nr:hypothetical protein [Tautonia rosea]